MFGTLIDYWYLTGDEQYNNITIQAMVHQAGEKNDFMPKNQTSTEGNDDQGFWAMAAMSAAENNFPNPPSDKAQWLPLAQAVFNQYVTRWEPSVCTGGMRWQIFPFNKGFDYKNSISNGCFFNIAARLAVYTGNSTYLDWADTIWSWQERIGLTTPKMEIYDGASIGPDNKCIDPDTIQWTYNAGVFMHGAAAMYNATKGNSTWKGRVDGMLKQVQTQFLKNGVLFEHTCESEGQMLCNNDQQSFKGYLIRWLAWTTQWVPDAYTKVQPMLAKAGQAAASSCDGPANAPGWTGAEGLPPFKGKGGTACGFSWLTGKFDGVSGVGQQMNALDAVMYNLINKVKPPVTADSGGTSKGDPSAGTSGTKNPTTLKPITTGDKAGAAILTVVMVAGVIGGTTFLVRDYP